MKTVAWVGAIAFASGALLGSVAVRALARHQAAPAAGREYAGPDVAVRATAAAETPSAPAPEDAAPAAAPPQDSARDEGWFTGRADDAAPQREDGWDERGPPWMRGDMTNRAEWAARREHEMRARAEAMRSNLVETVDLTDDQTVRLDVLIAAMNLRLMDQAEHWRAQLESGAMPRPEVRARVMSEVGNIMVLTYDEMDRNLPAGWRTNATTDVSLFALVDPEVWRELRPLMGGRPRRPGMPGAGPGAAR